MRKTKPRHFEALEPMPGVLVRGRIEHVEIRLIPALFAIAGSKVKNSEPSDNIYAPPRALYVSKNEDGTYAVFNRLELIEPDIARITAKWVTAYVIQSAPGQEEQESSLRTFLTTVDPARYCITGPQLLIEIFEGKLDKLASFYSTTRCKLGGWGMYRGLFSNNELPKSTFYRRKGGGAKEGGSSPNGSGSKNALKDASIDDTAETTSQNDMSDSVDSEPKSESEDQTSGTTKKPKLKSSEKKSKGDQSDLFDELDEPD